MYVLENEGVHVMDSMGVIWMIKDIVEGRREGTTKWWAKENQAVAAGIKRGIPYCIENRLLTVYIPQRSHIGNVILCMADGMAEDTAVGEMREDIPDWCWMEIASEITGRVVRTSAQLRAAVEVTQATDSWTGNDNSNSKNKRLRNNSRKLLKTKMD